MQKTEASTIHKYAIRHKRDRGGMVREAIRKRDRHAKFDKEGNPITLWVTTKLTIDELLLIHECVEDAIHALGDTHGEFADMLPDLGLCPECSGELEYVTSVHFRCNICGSEYADTVWRAILEEANPS